jgi:tRNA threonylcarbamoyl adenosine modification protein YeaZ
MTFNSSVRLYLSTSSSIASFGLEIDGELEVVESPTIGKHSDFINSQIASLYEKLKVPYNKTSEIILDHGPGSFTGVRVAVSFAKAFSYAQNIPISSINSLQALKKNSDPSSTFYGLNAFRNSIYFLISNNDVAKMTVSEFDHFLCQKSDSIWIVGDAFSCYESALSAAAKAKILKSEIRYPHVTQLHELKRLSSNQFQSHNWSTLLPYYVRLSSAEEVLIEKNLSKI